MIKIEESSTKQTATGQRQLYAVWRATEQAGQTVASLELLLTAAKASQQCKRSLLHESQALRLLGIAPSVTEERNQMEQEHANKRHALESKTHTSHVEFKAFAEALSSSLSWMSVTGEVSATDSSQNGNLDLAMEQLSRTTTILEAALFNELKSVTLLSNEWETLADTTESVTSILSSSDVKSVHDLNAFKTKNNSLDLLKRPGTNGTTGTGTSLSGNPCPLHALKIVFAMAKAKYVLIHLCLLYIRHWCVPYFVNNLFQMYLYEEKLVIIIIAFRISFLIENGMLLKKHRLINVLKTGFKLCNNGNCMLYGVQLNKLDKPLRRWNCC